MMDRIESAEAARALAQIRGQREQVVEQTTIPAWYWWVVGGSMVVLAAAIESRRGALAAVGSVVFAVGILAGTAVVVRRAIRFQVRADLIGPRGAGLIFVFVWVTVGVALAVAFGLRSAGVPFPATWGDATAAVCLVAGGPLLMRRLRRLMLDDRGTRRR